MTRGLNAAYVLPPDPTRAASFLTPALDRLDPAAAGPQLLLVTADAATAMALAAAADAIGAARRLTVLAATSAPRASRILRDSPPQIVVGAPDALVGLLQRSALKLTGVRQLVLAWLDDMPEAHTAALETLLAEVPKDAARTVVTRAISPAVEQFIERHARRARRVLPTVEEGLAAMPIQFVVVHEAAKPVALRRVIDELDPAGAFVHVRDPKSDSQAQAVLRTMGYAVEGPVRAGVAMEADADLLVLYDLPATRAELRDLTGGRTPRQVVALAQPAQLPGLRDIAGGVINPFVLPEAAARARAREEQLRAALRAELAAGSYSRELLTLEPMLAEFDGIEIAAAAVRLFEAERRRADAPRTIAAPRMARLFINAGQTDGIGAGDLVGAIANVAGLTGNDVGRIELRDRHALVEVPETVAAAVVEKLTGVTVKGRQIVARIDQERPERSGRDRPSRPERGDRPGRPERGDRGGRPER
ncbi:MAG: DbpA RNA binding domain-containing protein, partial [Gemmatimonadaceae bacterium]